MKIITIGHPCKDIIHRNNKVIESLGGIIYSLLGFYLVKLDGDEIFPLFNIDTGNNLGYINKINELNFDLTLIRHTDSEINKVHLFFDNDDFKFECYEQKSQKIDIDYILNNLDTDFNLYINMISGFELELKDLQALRNYFKGKIYFDFHTLTRGINDEGKRFYRPISEWRDWVHCTDAIQLNLNEMKNLTVEKLSEYELASEALSCGTKAVNITKGNQGAISYYRNDTEVVSFSAPPSNNLNVVNTIGCGDIFGAVFSYHYFAGKTIDDCLKLAVKVASAKAEVEDINDIAKLRETI